MILVVECNYPPYLSHGQIIGNHYEFGDALIYKCDVNYTLVGLSRIQCESNGNWSSPPGFCLGTITNDALSYMKSVRLIVVVLHIILNCFKELNVHPLNNQEIVL